MGINTHSYTHYWGFCPMRLGLVPHILASAPMCGDSGKAGGGFRRAGPDGLLAEEPPGTGLINTRDRRRQGTAPGRQEAPGGKRLDLAPAHGAPGTVKKKGAPLRMRPRVE